MVKNEKIFVILTCCTVDIRMESPGHGVGFAEADDDTGEDNLGSNHQEVNQTGDTDNDPAPASLRIIMLF